MSSTIDLSYLAKDSLATSSMSAGNMTSSNKLAYAAPGSEPVDPMPPASEQSDPAITAEPHQDAVKVDADGSKVTADRADRSDPFSAGDDGGWKTTQRSLGLPEKPRWSHGRVNKVLGGAR